MRLSWPDGARRQTGFTLIELMIAVTVMSILMLAAAPSLRQWIFNTRVRTAAEALQNGLRIAQSEAVSQNRQVRFGLTDDDPILGATVEADGRNWVIQTIPTVGEAARFVRGGPMADVTGGVDIDGEAAVCFSSLGNLVINAAAGCAAAATTTTYAFSHASGDRPLEVRLTLGGRVRMCDPGRPANTPDGC